MKVAVTKKHIKDGTANDNYACAVALAVQDSLKAQGLKDALVAVDRENVSVSFEAPLSKICQGFIEGFDQIEEPDPYDYDDGEDNKEYKAAKKNYDKAKARVKPFEFELKN
jgi:hypothetical protein